MDKQFPLRNYSISLPKIPHPGAFSSQRKFDVHTGIDLYCPENSQVVAIEDGIVSKILLFTGPNAGTPWWHETWAIMIKGDSGVFLYGEISKPTLKEGDQVNAGQEIGLVKTVLKKDKGLPMTMLHMELYSETPMDAVIWQLNQPQPKLLMDPTNTLKKLLLP